MKRDVITVERFYTEQAGALELQLVAGANGLKRIIREPTVNRPGLALAGFTRYFASKRVQVIGNAEAYFLKTLSPEERKQHYHDLFSYKIPCIVYSRDLQPDKFLLQAAEKADVPVFKCPLITMKFINLATLALEMLFAPRGTDIGSMVDVLGIGVIIRGESGIGKSETVLALIDRGYSLVSDDVTRVTLIDGRGAPSSALRLASFAKRGAGRFPASRSSARPADGPLTRTTAIAAGGAPLESAKIVSMPGANRRYSPGLPLSPSRALSRSAPAVPAPSMKLWNTLSPNWPIGASCLAYWSSSPMFDTPFIALAIVST
jgi:hypothetical protein